MSPGNRPATYKDLALTVLNNPEEYGLTVVDN
jgi:hypothetical protein